MLAGEECTVVSLSLVPPPLFLFGSDCVDRHLSCFAVPVLSAYVRMFVSSTYPLSLYARELCPSLHPPSYLSLIVVNGASCSLFRSLVSLFICAFGERDAFAQLRLRTFALVCICVDAKSSSPLHKQSSLYVPIHMYIHTCIGIYIYVCASTHSPMSVCP